MHIFYTYRRYDAGIRTVIDSQIRSHIECITSSDINIIVLVLHTISMKIGEKGYLTGRIYTFFDN